MAKNASLKQRIAWHGEHAKHCACRPVPEKLLAEMKQRGTAPPQRKRPKPSARR